jgi:preprotein translocase subunit SecA
MSVSLGRKQAIFREQLATGSPYIEKADRAGNGLDDALSRLWGTAAPYLLSEIRRRKLRRLVRYVEGREHHVTTVTDEHLRQMATELRARMTSARSGLQDLSMAFALARESTRRHTGMRQFPVQLLGGAAMMSGALAEMQTGEGKTLTAILPAVAAALMGRFVHIVTVNDYLARRDAELLRPVYDSLGLTVGLVEHDQNHEARRRAYACDITYCTNKELVFDYLRDRLALGARRSSARLLIDGLFGTTSAERSRHTMLRGLDFAIVDEADSVLIDEARTPLILSGTQEDADNDAGSYGVALDLARNLERGEHFHAAADERVIRLTERGERRLAELASSLGGLWSIRRAREELVQQALSALYLFRRDTQYIVSDGKVQIVDEYTGRVMPDRSWQHGLHQLIEAKEDCSITKRSNTLARITYQRFFRRYLHLCGMTGTAIETSGEMHATYGLRVVPIPTNRPMRRSDVGTRVFPTAKVKWQAVVESVLRETRKGRAVLIGTRSVDASEHVGCLLSASDLQPLILNARQDRQEAEIIAAAGQPGRVTVATNMAGRGTDILLHPSVREAGGLHVVLTEFHESRRIDRQLFGRAGRQGDPGSCEAIVAVDDELFGRFAGQRIFRMATMMLPQTKSVPVVIGRALRSYSQAAAERVHARARRTALADEDRFNRLLGFTGSE